MFSVQPQIFNLQDSQKSSTLCVSCRDRQKKTTTEYWSDIEKNKDFSKKTANGFATVHIHAVTMHGFPLHNSQKEEARPEGGTSRMQACKKVATNQIAPWMWASNRDTELSHINNKVITAKPARHRDIEQQNHRATEIQSSVTLTTKWWPRG
jgi:hypothetical protein